MSSETECGSHIVRGFWHSPDTWQWQNSLPGAPDIPPIPTPTPTAKHPTSIPLSSPTPPHSLSSHLHFYPTPIPTPTPVPPPFPSSPRSHSSDPIPSPTFTHPAPEEHFDYSCLIFFSSLTIYNIYFIQFHIQNSLLGWGLGYRHAKLILYGENNLITTTVLLYTQPHSRH